MDPNTINTGAAAAEARKDEEAIQREKQIDRSISLQTLQVVAHHSQTYEAQLQQSNKRSKQSFIIAVASLVVAILSLIATIVIAIIFR